MIDAHAHIFSSLSGFGANGELRALDNGKAIWANGEVIQLIPESYGRTMFTIEDLIALMDRNAIDKAVLLQGGFLGFDNHGVWEAEKKYSTRIKAAAAVDPYSRNLESILSHLLSLGFHTFKFEVSTGCGLMGSHRTFPLGGEMMYAIYSRLYGKVKTLAFDLGGRSEESHQIDEICRISRDFPDFNIVVCHLSSPRKGEDENLKRELDSLQSDNIFFDTAALFWKTRPEDYPFPTARKYLGYARDIVGAEHLMWGTDLPSTLTSATVQEQIDYVKGIFSEKEEKWFYSETAEKIYF